MKYHFQKVICCSCAIVFSCLGQDPQMQDTHVTPKLRDLFLLFYHGKRIISGPTLPTWEQTQKALKQPTQDLLLSSLMFYSWSISAWLLIISSYTEEGRQEASLSQISTSNLYTF